MKIKIKYFIPFFLLFNSIHSQTTSLDSLFAQFDSYRYKEVKTTLKNINENNFPRETRSDSIRLSLYNLINSKFDDDNNVSEGTFSGSIDYLNKIGLKDYLPYFLVSYAYKYAKKDDLIDKIKNYLDLSISISKNNKNKSHFLSVFNLYQGYKARDIIRLFSDKSYKREDLYESIKVFEANSNLISITNLNLFKDYYKIAFNRTINSEIRFYSLKKAFEYSLKLNDLPKLYKLRDLLSSFRSLDSVNEEIDYVNDKYYRKISNFKHLSKFDFLVNECYIDKFSKKSVVDFILHCNSLINSNWLFSESQIRDVYFITQQQIINYYKYLLENDKQSSLDESFFEKLFNFTYRFSKKYYTLLQQKTSIENIIKFYESSDLYSNSDKDLKVLDKELGDVLYEILISNDKEKNEVLSSNDLIKLIKIRASYNYLGLNKKEIENDLKQIFNHYKDLASYESLISALDLYWDLELSLLEMVNENVENEIEDTRNFIISNMNEEVSLLDLEFRIKLSKFNEITFYDSMLDDYLNKSEIQLENYQSIKLSLLYKKYELDRNKENAQNYCEYFINNINNPKFRSRIYLVMGIFIDYNLKKGLVKLSNLVLNQYDNYFKNETDSKKYPFQTMAGLFFKHIRNKERAINFFLEARANNYHWRSRNFTYNDLTSDVNLIYHLFDLYIYNDLKKSRYYLEQYKAGYEDLESGLLESLNISPELDKDMFLPIKRLCLDMERRQLFSEKRHEESEKIIDKMLVMEMETPYWGEFELLKLKISSQVSQKKYTDTELLSKLKDMYKKYNKPFDDFYNKWETILSGVVTKEFVNSRLSEFKEVVLDIQIMNDLSYESQVNFMIKAANDLYYLERDVYDNIFNIEQLRELVNYKFLLDNVDVYNTRILSLSDEKTDTYFELINSRFTETDYETLNAIKAQLDVFQQQIKVNSGKISKFTNITDFQKKLDSNQAYVRFSSVGLDKYIAYIVTYDNISLVNLKKSNIDKLVSYYSNRIKNKQEDFYSYDIFFKPIINSIPNDIDEIFIKNYGLLNNINFEALQNPLTKRYVFEDFKINYVERPESVFSMNNTISISSAFLFGNPNFTSNQKKTKNLSNIRSGLNPLPFTEVEINKLNNILIKNGISTVSTNLYESTEQSLYENSKSDIIHLATHGFYIDGKSTDRFNWGLLASGSKEILQNDFKKTRRYDGIIFGSEIILKNFTKVKLVVLSACETGYGTSTFFGGENLANSFLRAGAKNIISTLWPVDDEVTQIFMVQFYTDLLKTKNINLSLRNAKLKIKELYPDPLYWAPFVLTQNDIQ